jgi:hypothetical protein
MAKNPAARPLRSCGGNVLFQGGYSLKIHKILGVYWVFLGIFLTHICFYR